MDTSNVEIVEKTIRVEPALLDTASLIEYNTDWSTIILEYYDSISRISDATSVVENKIHVRESTEPTQKIASSETKLTPRGLIEDYIALSKKLNKTPTTQEIKEASKRGEIAGIEILKTTFGSLKGLEAARIKLEMIIALQIADELHRPATTEYESSPKELLNQLRINFSIKEIEANFGSVKNFFVSAGILREASQVEDPTPTQTITADNASMEEVSKYFQLTDEFIRIKICDMDQLKKYFVEFSGGEREYKDKIISLCTVDYEDKILPLIKKHSHLYKPGAFSDVLYQICVAVNPHLEIHQVDLPHVTPARISASSKNLDIKAVKARVLGQDGPIDTVCKKLKSAFTGLKDPAKPLGAFLFVGKTGGGKTELAKAISEVAFNSKIVRVDCSEYASPHEIAKLFGAPPGYIGHNTGGHLTNALIENPECVVLFDELEKAHQNLRNTMLQILDEGHLREGTGKLALFNKSLIIATSNAGVEDLIAAQHPTGFGAANVKPLQGNQVYQVIEPGLRHHFAPEFLNRFTAIVPFNDLDKSTIVGISKLALAKVASYSAIKIEFTPEVAHEIADLAFNPNFQAREVQRTVDREITSTLADIISENVLRPYHCIRVGLSPSKKFTFTVKRDAFSHFDVK